MQLTRNLRAIALGYRRDMNSDAQRLLWATMIMSSLTLGFENVTRVLFVLRLDLGTEFFGTFNTFRALGYMTMALLAGMLSSRIGLRNSMLLGFVFFALGSVAGSLVESLPHAYWVPYALGTQLISSGGFGMFAVNVSPALMSTTRPHSRSKIYGASSVALNIGILFGTLAGGLLPTFLARTLDLSLDSTAPFRIALLSCVVIAIPGLYVVSRYKEYRQLEPQHKSDSTDPFPILAMTMLLIFIIFSQGAINVCYAFCNAYMDVQLLLSPNAIGLLGGIAQLCAVAVPFMLPRLIRRVNHGNLLILVSLGSVLMLAPLAVLENWAGAGIGRLGLISMGAIWMPVVQIYQMEMVQREWRPLAYALVSVAQGLSFAGISYFGGRAISLWGYPMLFLICGVLTVVGCLVLFAVLRLPFMQTRYAN